VAKTKAKSSTPVTLTLDPRPGDGQNLKALRRQGRLPAIVYGHKVDPVPVMVDGREFVKALARVGKTQLVDLQVGSEPVRKALIREVQRSPRTGDLLHVDFYQVNLLEKIESEVPIELEGEVEIVSKGEADLLRALNAVTVECLPTDLPPAIMVDISGLKEVDDEIRVRDLKIPPGCEVKNEPDELVVKVQKHREEVVEEAPAPVTAEVPTIGETEAPPAEAGEAPAEAEKS
jgi:large subunit ribosomal protein L25